MYLVKRYHVRYSPYVATACGHPKCNDLIEPDTLVIHKSPIVYKNPHDGHSNWFHLDCIFDMLNKTQRSVNPIQDAEKDLRGYSDMNRVDKLIIKKKIAEHKLFRKIKFTAHMTMKLRKLNNTYAPRRS